jgi:hypothetical protein
MHIYLYLCGVLVGLVSILIKFRTSIVFLLELVAESIANTFNKTRSSGKN